MKTHIVKFKEWECILKFGEYSNGRTAIQLVSNDEYNEPIATATVNLPDQAVMQSTGNKNVFIKNYSENEGMLNCLVDAGIVSTPIAIVTSGFVDVPLCKLLVDTE